MAPVLSAPTLSAALIAAAICIGALDARAQDPFVPGLRWSAPADANQPSIPRSVAFSARDGIVWSASNGPHPGFAATSSAGSGAIVPRFVAAAPAGALGSMSVAAARTGEALFALEQVPAPDALHRATIVTRWSAISAASGASFAPAWTFDPGLRANGPARLGCDAAGTRVFTAAWDSAASLARVDVLDATSGASIASTALPAAALDEMAVADDGSRAAIVCGLDLWIVDAGCAIVAHRILALSTPAVAMSGDGALVAYGGDAVHVLARRGQGYTPAFDVPGSAHELARRADLSADGSTLAIGWWNASNGVDVRFEVWDVVSRTRIFQLAQLGVTGGLQNAPEVVRATADGSRVAFGCWGDGTSQPEIVLWDRATNAPVLQADLPGSVFALDIDAQGTRLVVGMKGAHANQFSGTGELRLYDTGERDLVQTAPAQIGGHLQMSAKMAGASAVFFLEGTPSPFPSMIAGTSGSLRLRRVGLHPARLPADVNGRADIALPLTGSPTAIGTFLHVQAAFRVNGTIRFGTQLIDALIL